MREARIMDIIGQQRGHFTVREPTVAFFRHASPGPEVHLVNGYGSIERVVFRAAGHPGAVLPRIAFEIPHTRSSMGPNFGSKTIGVGFVDPVASIIGFHVILVNVSLTDMGYERLPESRRPRLHWIGRGVPAVEITDDRNKFCIGGPHGKLDPALPITLRKVGAESFVGALKGAFRKQIPIEFA